MTRFTIEIGADSWTQLARTASKLEHAGVKFNVVDGGASGGHVCSICGKKSPSERGLSMHMARSHAPKKAAKRAAKV